MSLYAEWRASFINKAAHRLMEIETVDITYEEAHAYATAIIDEYDRIVFDELFTDGKMPYM